MRRLELALAVMTVVLVAAGIGLWIWRPPLRLPDIAQPPATQPSPVSSESLRTGKVAATIADAGVIVNENIFSSTRAAPRVRYTPPGAGDTDAFPAAAPADEAMVIEAPLPQVFGTMTGPGGATALIQPDSAGASGRLYREGDKVGEFFIIRITSGSVMVRGPGGRHELKVQPKDGAGR